jgi:hypothetical protein
MEDPIYRITWTKRRGRLYVAFRSYPITEGKPQGGSSSKEYLDVKVSVKDREELLYLAKKLGCEVAEERKWITTDNGDAYNRLMVYAVLRRSLRLPEKVEQLRGLVLSEDFAGDAWWWASTFTEIYQKKAGEASVGSRCLYRPAKAFKLLYNLAER